MAVADTLEGAMPASGERAAAPDADAVAQARELEAIFASAAKGDQREKFLPLTRYALMDYLTDERTWQSGQAVQARRYFRYADYWRQQSYNAQLLTLGQAYEPFIPDSDVDSTRDYSAEDKRMLQGRLVGGVEHLLKQANYTAIDRGAIKIIMTSGSHYGLDLQVDLNAFEELLIYFRGADSDTKTRRAKKKLYLGNEEFDVPVFRRLCVLFKLKSDEARIRDFMAEKRLGRVKAEKAVARLRALLPPQIKTDRVYVKLFKDIPQTDLEMVFPNARVKFRMFDKVKLGVTASGGLGVGAFTAAGKIAIAASNPVSAAGAVLGLGGVCVRQGMAFVNQKNKYMQKMAENLYFHSMADNRGAMTLLADQAAEQDIKEEMLLYSVLAKQPVYLSQIGEVDQAIEKHLLDMFDLNVDFDVSDALSRLIADGIVRHRPDGLLETLPPDAAALQIDKLWDSYLDNIPDPTTGEGHERLGGSRGQNGAEP